MLNFDDFINHTNNMDWSQIYNEFEDAIKDGKSVYELLFKLNTYQLREYHNWLLENFDIKEKDKSIL